MAIKKRTNKSVKSGKSETYNALRLKGELIEDPRSILDEKDQRTALSVGRDAIRVDGSVTVTGVEEGVYETDQILVLDGDRIKKRTASQISDELGDVQSIVYVTDDLSSITDSGGTADFFILGGNGVTTTTETKTVRISGVNATTSLKGVVELATTAETTTGTDTARAVTPDGLKDGYEGSTNVDTLGEVTTGSWEADEIANDYIADLPTSKITSGTMADARIAASNVTQHEGSIDAVGALDIMVALVSLAAVGFEFHSKLSPPVIVATSLLPKLSSDQIPGAVITSPEVDEFHAKNSDASVTVSPLECDAAVVPFAPLVNPVKSLPLTPVYVINS